MPGSPEFKSIRSGLALACACLAGSLSSVPARARELTPIGAFTPSPYGIDIQDPAVGNVRLASPELKGRFVTGFSISVEEGYLAARLIGPVRVRYGVQSLAVRTRRTGESEAFGDLVACTHPIPNWPSVRMMRVCEQAAERLTAGSWAALRGTPELRGIPFPMGEDLKGLVSDPDEFALSVRWLDGREGYAANLDRKCLIGDSRSGGRPFAWAVYRGTCDKVDGLAALSAMREAVDRTIERMPTTPVPPDALPPMASPQPGAFLPIPR